MSQTAVSPEIQRAWSNLSGYQREELIARTAGLGFPVSSSDPHVNKIACSPLGEEGLWPGQLERIIAELTPKFQIGQRVVVKRLTDVPTWGADTRTTSLFTRSDSLRKVGVHGRIERRRDDLGSTQELWMVRHDAATGHDISTVYHADELEAE